MKVEQYKDLEIIQLIKIILKSLQIIFFIRILFNQSPTVSVRVT